jgi:sporulation protein YlmC with PRC-barrel domain
MSETTVLVRLDDSELTLADPTDDVRGKTVVDTHGAELGEVDGLIIDREERRVRLLQIGSGGILGMGKERVLVPVDAVSSVREAVYVDTDREHVAGSPAYDPELVLDQTTATGFYDYYGHTPFWSAGYPTPGFPYRTG